MQGTKEIKEDKDLVLKVTILSHSPSEEKRVILREQAGKQTPNDTIIYFIGHGLNSNFCNCVCMHRRERQKKSWLTLPFYYYYFAD